jgi:DNA primase
MSASAERIRALTDQAQVMASSVEKAMPYLLSRGISAEVAAMFTLGYVDSGQFEGRLSIPYCTPTGVVQIKYRCANLEHGDHKGVDHCAKYLYDTGSSQRLFNAQVLASAEGLVILTEGELDAVCIQAYCGIPAVGYPGTETWTAQPHWALCFEGISEIVIIADADKPGRQAARTVAKSIGPQARILDLPDGHDANSYLVAAGPGAMLERLNQ